MLAFDESMEKNCNSSLLTNNALDSKKYRHENGELSSCKLKLKLLVQPLCLILGKNVKHLLV